MELVMMTMTMMMCKEGEENEERNYFAPVLSVILQLHHLNEKHLIKGCTFVSNFVADLVNSCSLLHSLMSSKVTLSLNRVSKSKHCFVNFIKCSAAKGFNTWFYYAFAIFCVIIVICAIAVHFRENTAK
ncbi:CLUMA_CG007433, isoform A [Clunio marinus]|uniref:CLUMA_CG007433, isoform A n=1 Tax=Clunio marinus TaxID=568069 RepID=A0A1J1I2B4_9DIPT|nr:CLUMA_CG007433, isoform A [Clunio marinus]